MRREKRELLMAILRDSGEKFISGEDLAQRFGCSRAAIWKSIAALRAEGVPIEAVTHMVYRLLTPEKSFLENTLEALRRHGMDHRVNLRVLPVTVSTNNDAREAAMAGEPEFSVFVGLRQTGGRGRRGREFLSDDTGGLWFSILLRPQLELREASRVTLLFGLAVLNALDHLCHISVGLKWPNDIISLQNAKKLCGILSETSMEENRISYAVIGCGVNVTQTRFSPEIEDVATSLCLMGAEIGREELLACILGEFFDLYEEFLVNPQSFMPRYRARCATLGHVVRVLGSEPFEGMAKTVTDDGDLVVLTDDGRQHIVSSGEVSIRLAGV
jgi:BirA family transcriptional regulator, biotin operon repressor / biotin---[acetyl-CoA-carboxylase] ligase